MTRDRGAQFDGETTERVSLAGCVLAAHPSVTDPMFARGVCLIVEHSPKGTVGVMLNRPLAIDPNPFWNSLFQGAGEPRPEIAQAHFNFGGPQNGPILAMHGDSNLAEGGNSQGVYLSAQLEKLQQLAILNPNPLRWFIGNATWKKSQLESQIVSGLWYVIPALPHIVFAEEEVLWSEAIRWVGQSVLASLPGIRDFPASPSLN